YLPARPAHGRPPSPPRRNPNPHLGAIYHMPLSRVNTASLPRPRPASVHTDVLVPDLRVGLDELPKHALALVVVQVDHLDAVLAQPVVAPHEVHRLPHHQPGDPELA